MKTVSASIAIGAVLALAAISTPAIAADEAKVYSARVAYDDLDLTTDAGAATLVARIRSATRRLCGESFPAPIATMSQRAECRRDAAERAIAQVDSARVSRVYAEGLPKKPVSMAGR